MLRLRELHPLYATVSAEEARLIANLGATVYETAGAELRKTWSAEMSAEEGAKADVWRSEGRVAALEEVKGRLTAAEEAILRVATAEGTVSALRITMEEEVTRRVGEALDGFRKDYELSALKEVAVLREQIAVAKMREELLVLLQEKVETLQTQLAEHTVSKSSHVIGKEGEATVWEMLETVIVPEFPYAEIKNMSGVSHAADFHLWVMGASGKRMKFLIDSKKYKRAVNTDEVNKLTADVDGDSEAHGGLLVSLTSQICAMRQFQIRCTDKGKPILYLSFADMDSADHAKLMCWGIRSLLAAVHETGEETTMEIERIEELLTDICTSLKEVDGMVKTQQKLMDSMRGLKTTVLQRIADFRQGSHTENDECTAPSGCCAILKTTCMPCGKEIVGDTGRCKQHSVRVKS